MDVFRVLEFRVMFATRALSRIGDQMAKVALAILVYDRTASTALAATTYALTFLPWIFGTPLAGLGDRFTRRSVLVWCDIVRALLVAAIALPGLPLAGALALLAGVSLLAPLYESTWSALLVDVLPGDRYVVGSALTNMTSQTTQVVGFTTGGLLVSLVHPGGALLLDALTFGASALMLARFVGEHRLAESPDGGASDQSWASGLRLMATDPSLRFLVLLAWSSSLFSIAPEGLAVAIVRDRGGSDLQVGLLTAAQPVGVVVGMALLARLVAPERRLRLLLPLALLSVAPLMMSAFVGQLRVLFVLWAIAGLGAAFNLPSVAAFIQAVPAQLRVRSIAVVQAGLAITQGVGLILLGLIAERVAPLRVVAASGALGTVAVAWLAVVQARSDRPASL